MTFHLRPYQQDLIDYTRRALQRQRAVIIQAPTGAGKTALAVRMLKGAQQRGRSCWFLVHRKELMAQTSAALWEQHVEHGLIASGRSMTRLPLQVGTIQSVANRLDRLPAPDLIVVDEAHRSVAPTFRKVIDSFPRARVVGLTATPERTDGHGLGDLYDEIIEGPSIRWLIDQGYLCDYRLFAPTIDVDYTGVKKQGGDWVRSHLEAVMDKPRIVGDAVEKYKQHVMGKRTITFCPGIKFSAHLCERFNQMGIPAEHVDGGHTDAERAAALNRFRRGETWVLCSIDLFIEGLDVPNVEVVQKLRKTESLIVEMQMNGRGFRPSPGKDHLIILDHVGNAIRPDGQPKHGLPDDDRQWSLEGRRSQQQAEDEDAVQIKQCPQCFGIYRLAARCPYCDAQTPVQSREGPEQVDGELAEVEKARERRERRREQGAARTIEELVDLGVRRGMRHPDKWAAHVYMGRYGRKPGAAHFEQAQRALKNVRETA